MAEGAGPVEVFPALMGAAYLKARCPNYEHRKGCTGKHAYVSLADAKNASIVKRHKMEVYACEHCGHWHTRGRMKDGRNP